MNENPQEFAAYLRAATDSVPPSSLDLDNVMVSARRKAHRHHTVVAGAVIAAMGLGSLGMWQALEHHDPPGASVVGAPQHHVERQSTDWPAGLCADPNGVLVVFDEPTSVPLITHVRVADNTGGSNRWTRRPGPDISLDAFPAGSQVLGRETRQAILNSTARNSQLVGLAVQMWGSRSMPRQDLMVAHANEMVSVVRASERVTVTGIASCGIETVEFTLSYSHYPIRPILWCGTEESPGSPAGSDLEAAALLAWCDHVAPEVEARRAENELIVDALIARLRQVKAEATGLQNDAWDQVERPLGGTQWYWPDSDGPSHPDGFSWVLIDGDLADVRALVPVEDGHYRLEVTLDNSGFRWTRVQEPNE